MQATFNVRTTDLSRLNSMTKYPSIPTYHPMGDRGELGESPVRFDGRVLLTEKIDGTNSRVILLPDGSYLIGSREELLHARGDLIANPALGIVEAVRGVAERLVDSVRADAVTVFYLETYGGAIGGNARQYSGEKRVGVRLFDVAVTEGYAELLERAPEQIAAWREGGGQPFVAADRLPEWAERAAVEVAPRVAEVDAGELPSDLAETLAFMRSLLPGSRAGLDGGAGGAAEGLVARTPDRGTIAKLRFEDYERTLRRRQRSNRA
jgi:hypothetical protein